MIEREWREASDLRTSRFALSAVLIAAAVLRFWALGAGIPYAVQIDEPEIVERAVNMMRSGSLHPHFFDYPSLYIYVQLVVACARFVAGAISGQWASLGEAPGGEFYLWGRAVTAMLGVVNVLLVYQIGARWGARHALLAAGLMAVVPVHVRYSHYVLTDTPLTLFATLTLLLSLSAHERGTVRGFAWAGAAAGLATATKYNGGITLIMPLIAAWMTLGLRPSRLQAALAATAACGVTFLVFAPFTVLALPEFLNSFARLAREYRVADLTEPAWRLYVKLLIRHAFGWPALLLALGGMVMGIVRLIRGPGRVRWALIVAFPVAYFWMLASQRIVYARYLLPLMPALCVLVAAAVVSGVSLLRRYEIPRVARTTLIAALTTVALLPAAIVAVQGDRDMARVGTVDLAYEWIVHNLPPNASIVIESRAMTLPDTFRAKNVGALRPKDYTQWRNEGADYLIASSEKFGQFFDEPSGGPQKYPREYGEYMRIFVQCREVARFSPTADHPGPELRVLKVIP